MPYLTTTGGLNFQYPTDGTQNWGSTLKTSFNTISAHNHTGAPNGVQLSTNSLQANAVTEPKIRLTNDAYLRGRNAADSADVNMIKVNASNVVQLGNGTSNILIDGANINLNGTLTFGSGMPSITFPAASAATPGIAFTGDPDTGFFSSAANTVNLSTGGTERWKVDISAFTSTLPVVHPLGAVGTPSVTFTGDLNTGVYSSGADTLDFATNGVNRFSLSTSAATSTLPVVHPLGSVSAPSLTFTGDLNTGVYSSGADTLDFATNGVNRFSLSTSATTSTLPVIHPLGSVSAPSLTFTGDLNTGIYSSGADTLNFATGGVARGSFDSSGNFGVGATAPSETLQVSSATPRIRLYDTDLSSTIYANISGAGGNGTLTLQADPGNAAANSNIGFDVDGANRCALFSSFFRFQFDSANKYLDISASTTNTFAYSSGGFYCGTTNADTAHIATNSIARFYITGAGLTYSSDIYARAATASSPRTVQIQSDGLIGTATSIRAAKMNIESIANASWLYQLNPVSFNYRKRDGNWEFTDTPEDYLSFGLIAEEVESVNDKLCEYNIVNDDKQLSGVNYSAFTPFLLKAIQELNTRLAALEAQP